MNAAQSSRRTPWGAVWAVLLLLLIEIGGLRSGWLWETIEDSPAFDELPSENLPPHALVRALALRSRLRRTGDAPHTVVVMGSSVVLYGLDETILSAALGRPVRFAWEGGADFRMIAAMTEFLVPLLRPSVVILAASPHEALEYTDPAFVVRRTYYEIAPAHTLADYAEACAQWVSHMYRYRAPLWQFLDLRWQRLMKQLTGQPMRKPFFDFTKESAPQVWRERQAWERTGRLEHYWKSMEPIIAGQPALNRIADDFRSQFRRRPHPQWQALDAWVATVRGAGAQPIIVAFPLNSMTMREDFSAIALKKHNYPIVPPTVPEHFVEDLRALAQEHDVPFWNRIDAYGPEAFYDYHHLMPGPRQTFSVELALWLRASGAVPAP